MAEQTERVEAHCVGDRQHVVDHPVERVRRRILWSVARTVSAVVEQDHRVVARQCVDVIGEVLLRAAESVHEDESGARPRDLGLEGYPVVRRDSHADMVTRIARVAPPNID